MLKNKIPGVPVWMMGLFLLAGAGVLAGGYWFYRTQEDQLRKAAEDQLTAIAQLKVAQIAEWRQERLTNAADAASSPFISQAVAQYLRNPNPSLAGDLLARFRSWLAHNEYSNVLLVDPSGSVQLSLYASEDSIFLSGEVLQTLDRAIQEQRPLLTDLHFPLNGDPPHMDAIAPIFQREIGQIQALGAIFFTSNAGEFLYPLVQSWPLPSSSAETLLVRRDGEDVIYLNELRHLQNTALTLKIPLASSEVPAVRAVLGEVGIAEGVDYRGVPVLAYMAAIPDSPWYMVAKVDSEEIFAPSRFRSRLILALIMLLLLSVFAAAMVVWQQTQTRYYRQAYQVEMERLEQRKQAETEIRRLNAELEQRVADRTAQLEASNRELEAFAYSVSHDLRAPLRAIDGFSQALVEEYQSSLPEEARDYIDRIRGGTQRMGQLIDDLLRLSRFSRAELRHGEVDLSALSQTILAELQFTHPERQVTVEIQPNLPTRGDVSLLRAAMENLLDNAWKFTRFRPQAIIQVGRLSLPESGEAFYVRDNGAGFNMAYVDKLFGVFQRLHHEKEFPGNGIGLATVQRIIHRHGGRIWAEAAVGGGATFFFTLPEHL